MPPLPRPLGRGFATYVACVLARSAEPAVLAGLQVIFSADEIALRVGEANHFPTATLGIPSPFFIIFSLHRFILHLFILHLFILHLIDRFILHLFIDRFILNLIHLFILHLFLGIFLERFLSQQRNNVTAGDLAVVRCEDC